MRQTLAVVTLLVVGLSTVPAPAVAAEDPHFEVVVPEPALAPGSPADLTVVVTNDPVDADDTAETAEDVVVELRGDDTPITVESGPRRLGSMADSDAREVTFRITVPRHIAAGTYDLTLQVTYEHDGETRTQSVPTTVRVDERARFEIVDVTTAVPIGGSGTYAMTVANVGSRTANATTIRLESRSDDVRFGGSGVDTRFVGTMAPGEETSVVYPVSVSADAEPATYAATATISYEDPDGIARTAPPRAVGVTPTPDQRFSLAAVNATLRAGEEGTVRGELVNDGDEPVRDVVLAFRTPNPTMTVIEPEYAVGDLGPGERGSFAFEVDVSDSATAGPRLFTLVPSFRTDAGARQEGADLSLRATVGPERDDFLVTPVETTFAAGEAGELVVEVTNNREDAVTDISAKLFTTSPISTGDDEAFIPELRPGDTRTVVFRVAIGGEALEKTYPVEMDFRFRTSAGDTRLSDTYDVPVTVTRPSGNELDPLVLGGIAAVIVVVGLGAYLYRRRTGPSR